MKNIIIAEDDKFLSNAYRVAFTRNDFDVRMANNGEEVFAILQEFTPDIILLDLIMPVKDGFMTLKELKGHEAYKKIPVVVASNLGQAEDFEKEKTKYIFVPKKGYEYMGRYTNTLDRAVTIDHAQKDGWLKTNEAKIMSRLFSSFFATNRQISATFLFFGLTI